MLSNPNISETFVHADGTDMTWHLFCQELFILCPSISHVHPKNVPNTHHFLYHIPRVILSMWVQKRSKVSIAVCFVDHLRFLDHQPMGLRGKNPWKDPMGHRPFRTSTHHQKASGFRAASFGLHCVYTELHAHVVDIYIYIQYIYIYMVGWWNVTVHKMGIRMKQPVFHGMTS